MKFDVEVKVIDVEHLTRKNIKIWENLKKIQRRIGVDKKEEEN